MQAPFPWFGGKSRVGAIVWHAFGNVRNYVEPFFGSVAVLLARPLPSADHAEDADQI
jgi:site-specific DNA-adenine methylase